jgi:hypothetical protein
VTIFGAQPGQTTEAEQAGDARSSGTPATQTESWPLPVAAGCHHDPPLLSVAKVSWYAGFWKVWNKSALDAGYIRLVLDTALRHDVAGSKALSGCDGALGTYCQRRTAITTNP